MLRADSRPPLRYVLWTGGEVPVETRNVLNKLDFELVHEPDAGWLEDEVKLLDVVALVVQQSAKNPTQARDFVLQHAARLLDRDCLVFVSATENGWLTLCRALENGGIPYSQPPGTEQLWTRGYGARRLAEAGHWAKVTVTKQPYTAGQLATDLFRYGATRRAAVNAPSVFQIEGAGTHRLSASYRTLLRRGFRDCTSVHLTPLQRGASGGDVFLARANFASAPVLRQATFFVKLGGREKLYVEWDNYYNHVRASVPFYLTPRFNPERCAIGAREAILIGDFVDESESLADCARTGRGVAPLAALFEKTLRNWHTQARDMSITWSGSCDYLLRGQVAAARMKCAAALGAARRPAEIVAWLRQCAPETALIGTRHGDLHAENIRTRGPDALIIDFGSTGDGPVIDDAAALEVSLLIRVPQLGRDDFKAWKGMADMLFTPGALESVSLRCDLTEPYAWLFASIRQVRLHALPLQRHRLQYARALAFRLYQAATKDRNKGGPESVRRAYALVLADRVLNACGAP